MNKPHPCHAAATARSGALPVPTALLPAVLLLVGLLACGGPGASQSGADGRARRVRLEVGKIKEVTLPLSADTSLHLYSSSENKEIVDVSVAESAPDDLAARPAKGDERALFYIKAISPGKANVVFSEKKTGQEGPGRTLRTYAVEVTE